MTEAAAQQDLVSREKLDPLLRGVAKLYKTPKIDEDWPDVVNLWFIMLAGMPWKSVEEAFAAQMRHVQGPPMPKAVYDRLHAARRKGTVQHLIAVAAGGARSSVGDLTGPVKVGHLVKARHAIAYVAKRETNQSLGQIGLALGGRDHSTIKHAVSRAEDRIRDGDEDFIQLVFLLTEEAQSINRMREAHAR